MIAVSLIIWHCTLHATDNCITRYVSAMVIIRLSIIWPIAYRKLGQAIKRCQTFATFMHFVDILVFVTQGYVVYKSFSSEMLYCNSKTCTSSMYLYHLTWLLSTEHICSEIARVKKKQFLYSAISSPQSTLHFTSLTDLFNQTPSLGSIQLQLMR